MTRGKGKAQAVEDGEEGAAEAAPSGSQTLLRGLDLIEAVAEGSTSLSQLISRLQLTRSTTHRLAKALADRRYLTFVGGREYQLGPKLLELGFKAQHQADLVQLARSYLRDLSERTGLSTFLGAREGDYSVNLFSSPGSQRVRVATPVGTRRRLAETSIGKALILDEPEEEWRRYLAQADPSYCPADWLTKMRASAASGVVIHAGPPPESIRSAAAPVRDASGAIVAAISMVTVVQYYDEAELAKIAPAVQETAAAMSRELGWRGPKDTCS